MRQITDKVIMVRPRHFGFNEDTRENNTFQSDEGGLDAAEVARRAVEEFDSMVDILHDNGVKVDVIDDTDSPQKPDAIFPNNWFSTHEGGIFITYPMFSPMRREERQPSIIDEIGSEYEIAKRYAFEHYEENGIFLEGTGSLVLDRQHKVAYAVVSARTDVTILDKWCVLMGYSSVIMHAVSNGVPVYHTNVIMTIGATFALICLECMPETDQQKVRESLIAADKEVIPLTLKQMHSFAGNMLQLMTGSGESILVMSDQAHRSLDSGQIKAIGRHSRIVSIPIYTIEKYGGGSVRCMIAENFLNKQFAE